jgi:hypothetical protein
MAKRNYGFHKTPQILNLTIQALHIQRRFPGFSYSIRNGLGLYRGFLQPRFTSPRYMIEVQYRLKEIPKVWVLSPPLHPQAVHLYEEKNLCLYWPQEWRWTGDQIIAETIIPWTGSWLYFYELWLDTGKWLGPSSHDYFPAREQHADKFEY